MKPQLRRQTTATTLAVAAAATLLIGAIAGCSHKREAAAPPGPALPPIAVKVGTVDFAKQPAAEEVVATVRAKLRATLEAKVSGRIDRLPVVLGQAVSAGQLVVELASPEIRARLDQAQGALQQAEREQTRLAKLFAESAATKAELDAADSRLLVARGMVAEAQAMADYTQILAPFAGVVARKHAEVGDLALPGKPLVELEDASVFELEADLPEAIAPRVHPQDKLGVLARTAREDATNSSPALTATVTEISPSADPQSRTLRVKLDLPRNSGLAPGQFARLVVPTGEVACLRVPASAVVRRGQLEIAFVAENDKARMHLIKTGRGWGRGVEVLSGLEAGERVVVDGAGQLTDGQPLTYK